MSKPFCSLPWTGIHVNQELNVYYCCIMAQDGNQLGNLKNNTLEEILSSPAAVEVRKEFIDGVIPKRCQYACGTRTGTIISDLTVTEQNNILKEQRTEYLRVHSADIRSSNLCTLDCVYCSSLWSSTIAQRDNEPWMIVDAERMRTYQGYISNIDLTNCRRLYLAGGEPLLMKEYVAILQHVLEHNPECSVEVNTGLSVLNTPVYRLLSKLKNVTWIVSVDSTDPAQFEYVRHGNTWKNFINNLEIIKSNPDHVVTAHSVYFLLSYSKFDQTLKDLTDLGVRVIHIDPVSHPVLDFRNLPSVIPSAKAKLEQCLAEGLITEQKYVYLLNRILEPASFTESVHNYLETMNKKYNMNSRNVFPELYTE